jgi:HrpA-like RNA helicase
LALVTTQGGGEMMIDVLISAGCDVNKRNYQGESPLFFYTAPSIIKHLLNYRADPFLRDNEGKTALDIAALDEDGDPAFRELADVLRVAMAGGPAARLRPSDTVNSSARNSGRSVKVPQEVEKPMLIALPASDLPIVAYSEEILRSVDQQTVTILQGETGSGKSSQLPRILVDNWRGDRPPFVYVTQPRRIAAISLARRVASEYGETVGNKVGFLIGNERAVCDRTQITFVTTGWLLQKLIFNPDFFYELTHLVLDEIHERGIDADLLYVIVKRLLANASHRAPRLVLMSATFNTGLFSQYFCPDEPLRELQVKVRKHKVDIFHLENLYEAPMLKSMPRGPFPDSDLTRLARKLDSKFPEHDADLTEQLTTLLVWLCRLLTSEHHTPRNSRQASMTARQQQEMKSRPALARPANEPWRRSRSGPAPVSDRDDGDEEWEGAHDEPGSDSTCCILVFVAGMGNIESIRDRFDEDKKANKDNDHVPGGRHWYDTTEFCMLHSVLDSKDQDAVFERIPHGHSRIILSTNIAESSVTIPGVRYVVDFGTHKEVEYDPRYRQDQLKQTWVSRSSAKQRAGRAGRLFPGHVFRLYPSALFERMEPYDRPEMLRKSLSSVILKLKSSCHAGNEAFRSAFHILQGSLQPPPLNTITEAYKELIERGALVGSTQMYKGEDFQDNTKITNLGAI